MTTLVEAVSRCVLTVALILAVSTPCLAGPNVPAPAIAPEEGRPVLSFRDAGLAMGEIAYVYGPVDSVQRRGRVNLLNFVDGGDFVFQAVIMQEHAGAFSKPLDELYAGRQVRVRGWVSSYAGVPQIRVTTPEQITVLEDGAELPAATQPHPQKKPRGDAFTVATFNILNLFDENDDPYRDDDTTPMKPREELERLAEAIRTVNADVLALQEVESRGYLERFNRAFLSDMGYDYVVHFESNDTRGIDNAVLSRLPIGPVTSHRHVAFPSVGDTPRTFERDLLVVQIQPPGTAPLELWVVHLKSNYDGRTYAEPVRLGEARQIRKMLDQRLTSDPKARLAILGDFNDTLESQALTTIIGSGAMAMTVPAADPQIRSMVTYNKEPYRTMIDFILLSPELGSCVVPGSYTVREGYVSSIGSDHNPVSVDLRYDCK